MVRGKPSRTKPRFASGSSIRSATIRRTSSSGTSPPISMIPPACAPTAVPARTADRHISPVDRCEIPSRSEMRTACVPLPAPGGPKMISCILRNPYSSEPRRLHFSRCRVLRAGVCGLAMCSSLRCSEAWPPCRRLGAIRHAFCAEAAFGDRERRRQADLFRLKPARISSKLSFRRSWMIFAASPVDCLAVVALSCAPLTAISKTFLANSVCRARLS